MRSLFFIFSVLLTPFLGKAQTYNINDYGAVGDSLKINTTAIQKTIDICSKNGGGTVIIDNGIYISGTILLKDNVRLHINEDAKLVGSSNPNHYQSIDTFVDATGQERGNCLIGSISVNTISITGKGTIDGNGAAFTYENIKSKKEALRIDSTDTKFGTNRPFLLRFVKSSNIKLQDIQLRQPAAWTCHFYQSHDILVDNISIYSHANHNNDGIDLDSSFNATITNTTIDTGDDAICFKTTSILPTYDITVLNCTLTSEWGAIKFGTESMGDFYNITIKDCKIKDTQGGGIKILSVDGAKIHDIIISDIQMENTDMPIFMRLGERLRTYRNAPKQAVGSIYNIQISNIKATTRIGSESRVNPPSGIFMTGTPNHRIGSIHLKDIDITVAGGGSTEDRSITVAEDETKYPEFSFFKVLPAYGLYVRHLDGLYIESVTINAKEDDKREAFIFEDVQKKIEMD